MEELQECIRRNWIHSHEEDTQSVRVYRPATYAFPPSRGRRGFEFQEDGKLIYHGIAAADGSEQMPGRWAMEAPNRIMIEVDSERISPFALEIVSCDEHELKVRR